MPRRLTQWLNLAWQGLVLAALFCIPLQTRWIFHDATVSGETWEYGRFSLYGMDLLIAAALLFFLADAAIQAALPKMRRHSKPRLSPLIVIPLAGLALTAFISLQFAADASIGWNGFVRLLEGTALFSLLTQMTISWRLPAWTLIASGMIQSGIAFEEFLIQSVPASAWLGMAAQNPAARGVQVVLTETGRYLRAYGTFPHPNILGGFQALALLLALALAVTYERDGRRTLVFATLPLLTVGLFLSFSRQSALALMVASMAFPALMSRRALNQVKTWAAGIAWMLLTGAAFSAIFSPLVYTRLQAAGPLEERSLETRAEGLKQSIDFLSDYWLQGAGPGNYTVLLKNSRPDLSGLMLQPVHNLFLLVLIELGVFGLLFLLLACWFVFYEGRHHPDPRVRTTRLSAAGALVILPLFLGLWDHYLWSLPVGQWMFWTMLGLAVLVSHVRHAAEARH